MKVYTKVKIDIDTGETIEEEFYEYDGPVALLYDGPGGGPGLGGIGGTPGPDGPGVGPGGPDFPIPPVAPQTPFVPPEPSQYELLLQQMFEMMQKINSGELNKTGQLVGGRGKVGSPFSYLPQMEKDKMGMQLQSILPFMQQYQWDNPRAEKGKGMGDFFGEMFKFLPFLLM